MQDTGLHWFPIMFVHNDSIFVLPKLTLLNKNNGLGNATFRALLWLQNVYVVFGCDKLKHYNNNVNLKASLAKAMHPQPLAQALEGIIIKVYGLDI